MADLHLRNAIHKNLTEDEGLEAYNVRLVLFFGRLLLGETEGESSLDNERIKKHLFDYWRMEIIPAPQGIDFVTSDPRRERPNIDYKICQKKACKNPESAQNRPQIMRQTRTFALTL